MQHTAESISIASGATEEVNGGFCGLDSLFLTKTNIKKLQRIAGHPDFAASWLV